MYCSLEKDALAIKISEGKAQVHKDILYDSFSQPPANHFSSVS